MKVPNEPGLSPNNGLENAFLSDQSMASNPRKGQAKSFGAKTTSHDGKAGHVMTHVCHRVCFMDGHHPSLSRCVVSFSLMVRSGHHISSRLVSLLRVMNICPPPPKKRLLAGLPADLGQSPSRTDRKTRRASLSSAFFHGLVCCHRDFQKSLSQQLACLVLCRTECVASETTVTCALQSIVFPSFTFKSEDVTPRAVLIQKGYIRECSGLVYNYRTCHHWLTCVWP